MEIPQSPLDTVAGLSGGPGTGQNLLSDGENRGRIGCGCLGTIVLFLGLVYAVASWWMGGSDFALVLVGVMGLAAYTSAYMRGYHFLTGAAWLLMGLMALGVSPTIFSLIHPDAPITELPSFMQQRPVMMGLVMGSLVGLGVLLTQMRKVASTQEAIYAIQIQAAARKMDLKEAGEQMAGAFGVLQECAELGCWPISADYLNVQEHGMMPTNHPARLVLKPLLVIRADAVVGGSEGGWFDFGRRSYLTEPVTWSATVEKLAPRSAGLLFCDGDTLHYAPLRKGVHPVSLPLSTIKRARMHIHAVEFETDDKEVWTFAGVHLWRTMSMALFLSAYEIDTTKATQVLWATGVRSDNRLEASAILDAIPSAETLAPKVERAAGSVAVHRDALNALVEAGYPALRALADRLVGIWEMTKKGEHALAQEALDNTALWLDSFPEGEGPTLDLLAGAARLIDDIEGVLLLASKDWEELSEFLKGWLPWEEDAREARHKALVAAAVALEKGEDASALIEEARAGWPGSLFMEALDGVALGGSAD